jgi:hypothetical protein
MMARRWRYTRKRMRLIRLRWVLATDVKIKAKLTKVYAAGRAC